MMSLKPNFRVVRLCRVVWRVAAYVQLTTILSLFLTPLQPSGDCTTSEGLSHFRHCLPRLAKRQATVYWTIYNIFITLGNQ